MAMHEKPPTAGNSGNRGVLKEGGFRTARRRMIIASVCATAYDVNEARLDAAPADAMFGTPNSVMVTNAHVVAMARCGVLLRTCSRPSELGNVRSCAILNTVREAP